MTHRAVCREEAGRSPLQSPWGPPEKPKFPEWPDQTTDHTHTRGPPLAALSLLHLEGPGPRLPRPSFRAPSGATPSRKPSLPPSGLCTAPKQGGAQATVHHPGPLSSRPGTAGRCLRQKGEATRLVQGVDSSGLCPSGRLHGPET